jgi:predicted  nucleic acid-binding Zn-ribbon protein
VARIWGRNNFLQAVKKEGEELRASLSGDAIEQLAGEIRDLWQEVTRLRLRIRSTVIPEPMPEDELMLTAIHNVKVRETLSSALEDETARNEELRRELRELEERRPLSLEQRLAKSIARRDELRGHYAEVQKDQAIIEAGYGSPLPTARRKPTIEKSGEASVETSGM